LTYAGSRRRFHTRRLALEELEQRLVLSNYSLGVISDEFFTDGLDVSPAEPTDSFDFELADDVESGLCARFDFTQTQDGADLQLYDAQGALLAAEYGTAGGGQISLQGLSAGNYSLLISAREGADIDYSLTIGEDRTLVVGDWAESNDTVEAANNLGLVEGLNEWTDLNIHSDTDRDWFRFATPDTGQTGQYARIEFTHDLGDLDMRLYDSGGTSRSPRS